MLDSVVQLVIVMAVLCVGYICVHLYVAYQKSRSENEIEITDPQGNKHRVKLTPRAGSEAQREARNQVRKLLAM